MKTALHILLGLVQLALALPFLISALWFLFTGQVIHAFTSFDWGSAAFLALASALWLSLFHLVIED